MIIGSFAIIIVSGFLRKEREIEGERGRDTKTDGQIDIKNELILT